MANPLYGSGPLRSREGLISRSAANSDEIQLRIDPMHVDLDEEISVSIKRSGAWAQVQNIEIAYQYIGVKVQTSDLSQTPIGHGIEKCDWGHGLGVGVFQNDIYSKIMCFSEKHVSLLAPTILCDFSCISTVACVNSFSSSSKVAQEIETEAKFQNDIISQLQMTTIKAQAALKNNMRRMNKSIIQHGSNHVVHVILFALFCFFVVYLLSKFSGS
ncbi:bet1-like protein At4g14600 [Elaeis guineensis]|uniref:bet1-like protein At4g14600 n=1 Tax=Elaeis guineensis var. tenera TaxID=51953 RepID=UPI003C6D63CF